MKKTLYTLVAVLLIGLIVGCSSDTSSDENGEEVQKDQTITLGITPWTSTVPPTAIANLILQDMGYDVEEIEADAGNVFAGLSRGDIDVFMDAWEPSHNPFFEKYADTIDIITVSYDDASSGWVVPTYMEDINSVGDIIGNEELFDYEMYAIEEGAGSTERINDMIDAHEGLEIEQVNSSEGAMLAMAKRKIEKEEPVIFYGWRPHSMFNEFDIKILEDEEGFYGVPSIVHVISNHELQETAPEVYKFLSNWTIPIDDVEEFIVKVDEGEDPKELAREWIDENEDKVNEMIGE